MPTAIGLEEKRKCAGGTWQVSVRGPGKKRDEQSADVPAGAEIMALDVTPMAALSVCRLASGVRSDCRKQKVWVGWFGRRAYDEGIHPAWTPKREMREQTCADWLKNYLGNCGVVSSTRQVGPSG